MRNRFTPVTVVVKPQRKIVTVLTDGQRLYWKVRMSMFGWVLERERKLGKRWHMQFRQRMSHRN